MQIQCSPRLKRRQSKVNSIVLLSLLAGLSFPSASATDAYADVDLPQQLTEVKLAGNTGLKLSINQFGDEVQIASSKGTLVLRAVAAGVIRVRGYVNPSALNPAKSLVVNPDAFQARSQFRIGQNSDSIDFDTGEVKVRVYNSSLRISFLDQKDRVISEDLPDQDTELSKGADPKKGFAVFKKMPEDEHYYGMGDKTGPLDRRGGSFTFWNTDPPLWQESSDPLYKSIPFVLAMRGGSSYGIFLNSTFRSYFDMGKTVRDVYSFGAERGAMDYYFFYGPDPKNVIEQFTALVGRMPLPPLFSLGYQQSRGSYFPDSKVKDIANELRKRKIPTDVIYLDGDYKQGGHPFTVDKKLFPDLAGLLSELKQNGFKTVISMDPYVSKTPGEKPYDEGLANGYFAKNPDGAPYVGTVWPGDVCFADFANSKVRAWWGGLHSAFIEAGVRGIWDDMNEPAVFKRADRTVPLNVVHDLDGEKQEHRQFHNIFAMQNTRATYDGLLALKPNQRPFVLTRSGFAGSQRFAATWTGDNTSSWNHMRISVPELLNLGVSGYTFAGADIGGFNGFSGGPTPELLTRWMQLGAFNPLFRNHSDGVTRPREPWVDGPEHEAARRRLIEERYKLLPYIYTSMEEASRTGVPLMRPMFLDFPKEDVFLTNGEQFMFGSDLLVAPKLWEIPGSYPVQLPAGAWYEYWTGKKVAGAQCLSVDPALNTMPIYVREGAMLPVQAIVQNVEEKPAGPLQLRFYLKNAENVAATAYFDDGDSFDYKKGQYLRLQSSTTKSSDRVDLKISCSGEYKAAPAQVKIALYGVDMTVGSITVDGSPLQNWVQSNDLLTLPELALGAHQILIARQK